jgi:hypothetical protein
LKQIVMAQGTQARILLTSRRDEQAWLGGLPHRVAMPRMSGFRSSGCLNSRCMCLFYTKPTKETKNFVVRLDPMGAWQKSPGTVIYGAFGPSPYRLICRAALYPSFPSFPSVTLFPRPGSRRAGSCALSRRSVSAHGS